MTIDLERHLRARRDAGRKLLVVYLTGGLRDDWCDVLRAVVAAGADAVEVGIPFSDPAMDGPVIQEASVRALARGTTPRSLLTELADVHVDVPLAVMTYYNLIFRFGHERFADAMAHAGVSGAILPDLPIELAGEWCAASDAAGREPVLLVAPNTPDDRLRMIAERTRGFLYVIGLLGVTGVRDELAASAAVTGRRAKQVTDKPVLIGVGVSTPVQAQQAAAAADGVVVGSAVVQRMLDGDSPEAIGALVAEFRGALDG